VSEQGLTILMPVFNVSRYVGEAIESVLAQTHRNFSLRILDDGSTDDTLSICRKYETQDNRITVTTHANIGIANTMNTALESIEGGWVFCMHGDDVMLPNRLERQLDFIQKNPDLAVASTLVHLINETGREIGRMKSALITRAGVSRALTRGQCIAFNHPATAFRAEVIKSVGGYRQDFWPAEDTELWNRVAAHGHLVLVQDEFLLKYRIHGQAASTRKARLMVQKLAWMADCIAHRRLGQPEPTWNAFVADQELSPWPVRLNNRRKETARTLYQAAVHYFASRQYAVLLPALACAMMLEPSLVLPRILPRLLAR
jgi:glycosyltransferase involved in cell wall biosynthesis